MRFTGINSFVLACKELEKAGLIPVFIYSELRQTFKEINTPIANLDAIFYFEEVTNELNIYFNDKKGKEVLNLKMRKNKYDS